MGDDHHRAIETFDQFLQQCLAIQVQVVIRLIEQENIRPADDDARQADQFFLAAAEMPQGQIHFVFIETDILEQFADSPGQAGPAQGGMIFQNLFLPVKQSGQPAFMVVDHRVSELLFDLCQFTLQSQDPIRPLAYRFKSREGRRKRDLLGHIGNRQVLLSGDKTGVGLKVTQDQLEQRGLPRCRWGQSHHNSPPGFHRRPPGKWVWRGMKR